jgi:hypothetical protein
MTETTEHPVYTQHESTVALLLKNTYWTEATHYSNAQSSPEMAVNHGRWDTEFGDIGPADDAELSAEADIPRKNKKNKIWLRVARLVIENKLDPEIFVRRQFGCFSGVGKPPRPEMMLGPAALKRYEDGREISARDIEVALGTQKQTMRTNIAVKLSVGYAKEQAWEDVLLDLDLGMSALFRYCMAVSMANELKSKRFMVMAGEFRTPAAIQYVRDAAAYDQFWKDLIPRYIRKNAEEIYRRFFER